MNTSSNRNNSILIMKQKFEKQNKMVKIYFSEFIAHVQF